MAAELPEQGITGLLGPSGCGKTTLLRAIAGLERAQGFCRVGGTVWQDEKTFLPPHRRPLGYVFQEARLFPHLSVEGNLAYGLRRVPKARRRVAFREAVELLGLERLLGRSVHGLSGGEQSRVAIARALLTSPRLLLMDEPLAALDPASKQAILPYLERLHQELRMPILYVSHATDEVARLADHLLVLEGGRVKAQGPLTDLLTRLDLACAREEAEAVVEAQVAGFDEAFQLSLLDFPGGRFFIPHPLPLGKRVRLRVLARDVSLVLEPQQGTSILNVFPAVVTGLLEERPAQVLVRLEASGIPLLARVTKKSAHALGLAPGRRVYAQVKAVAVLD